MQFKSFEEIIAWQKSQSLAAHVYNLTFNFEDEGFKDQYRRAVVSISSNIAEGYDRKTAKQFHQFLQYASGSCSEVASLTYLAKQIDLMAENEADSILSECLEISKIIGGLRKYLRRQFSD